MRRMTLLTVLALVALIAAPTLAKDMAKTSWRVQDTQMGGRDLAEGFETAVPPAGWTVETPSGHGGETTWFQSDESAYAGTYSAQVNYDEALVPQDCRLSFEYTIAENEDHLNFWVSASAYWLTNYTLKVLVDEDEVFDLAAEYGEENWIFELMDIDLSAYLGDTVTITFQYLGTDGAALYLDEVGVNAGADVPPPPEAPENDTCDGAIVIAPGAFDLAGDLTAANDDYDPGSGGCTGYAAAGNDAVYAVHLEPGDRLTATYTNVADGSLYLISDCADPVGSCVAGADDTVGGQDEVIDFTNEGDAAMDLYLVVDCYGSGNGGTYTLVGVLEGTVPVEATSWTSLKSSFR